MTIQLSPVYAPPVSTIKEISARRELVSTSLRGLTLAGSAGVTLIAACKNASVGVLSQSCNLGERNVCRKFKRKK